MAAAVTIIPLAFPTADNTVITADTINFTADGACLINGGAVGLPFGVPGVLRLGQNVDNPYGVPYIFFGQ
jgi:hypothetical protein